MASVGTPRHKPRLVPLFRTLRVALVGWLLGSGSALADGSGSIIIDYCANAKVPPLSGLSLVHDAGAAPREGFFFSFLPGALPGMTTSRNDVLPAAEGPFSAYVEGASGERISAVVRSSLRKGLAVRPERTLAPTSRYTIHTRIDYNSQCFVGPPVEQRFDITTEIPLRESVPPALDQLAYGLVWVATPRSYCCRTEAWRCDAGAKCYACWDYVREPVIFLSAKADPPGEESRSLITELTVTDADGTLYVNNPENWRQASLTPIYPVSDGWFDWGPNPTRICVSVETETVRTGARMQTQRCIDIDPVAVADGSSLGEVELPERALRTPPGGTMATALPTTCASPQTPSISGAVYHTRFVTSLPWNSELFYDERSIAHDWDASLPGAADASVDAAPPPFPAVVREDTGCRLGTSRSGGSLSTLLLALSWVGLRRRPRRS